MNKLLICSLLTIYIHTRLRYGITVGNKIVAFSIKLTGNMGLSLRNGRAKGKTIRSALWRRGLQAADNA